jgi:Ca-activated chloride channel family protein
VVSPTGVIKSLNNTGGVGFSYTPVQNEGPDRTLAPYFYVSGGDPEKDRLPLKETSADVNIAGVIAAVKVHQVFENRGGKPIEAVYVFPASTRAAVHAMRMKIGARTVEAKIQRKQEARQQYEQAKAEGRRASLLEQERPNVFTTSVANIMPSDRIEVELNYSEMIVPEDATYEFVYPTVVGPRYAGGANPQTDQWMANPHLGAGQAEPYAWNIKLHLQTGIGIKEISSPSHKIAVNYVGPTTADVRLDQAGGGNKDFVLRYRLAGDKIETGLLLYEEPSANLNRPAEKFFALLMEPPRRPVDADIPSREYIFLLDVSGSMHGFPLDTTKALMRDLFKNLRPTDHFNVALFSGANYVWSPQGSKRASKENIAEAIDIVERQTGGGGTELMGGLEAAYRIPAVGKGVSRTVVVATDGYVGVEAQAFRFIRQHLDEANLFAFGIGSSVNRGLIEGMARAGLGEPFVVLRPDKAAAEAEKLRKMIDRPVLTDVRVNMQGVDAYEIAPEKVPDLLAERPLLLFGKYRGDRAGKIEITGRSGRGAFSHSIDLRPADARGENMALRALWTRKWVEILEDELHMGGGQAVENAITDLGLFYSLLTPFTSFVAIDSEIANRTGRVDTVRQALPMPEGVSNMAIGGLASTGAGAAMPKQMRLAAAPAKSAPVAMAPPPPPSPVMAAAEMVAPAEDKKAEAPMRRSHAAKDDDMERERGKAKGATGKKPAACTASVSGDKATNIGAIQPLLDLVQRTAASAGCTGSIKLRITVDASGKIIKVERLSGDEAVAKSLISKLNNATTATKANGATGTVEVTVTLSR